MRPLVPTAPGTAVDQTLQGVDRLVDDAHEVLQARKASEVLKSLGIAGGGSSTAIPEGLGGLLTGVGNLMEGSGSVQKMLLEHILARSGGTSDSSPLMLILVLALLERDRGKPAESADSPMMVILRETLAEMRSLREKMFEDLQERSGPGPFDGAMFPVMQQWAGALAAKAMNPEDPLEVLDKALERVQRYAGRGALGHLLGPGAMPQVSPEHLQALGVYYGHMEKVGEQSLRRAELQAGQQRLQQIPQIVGAFAAGIDQALEAAATRLGLGPLAPPSPEAAAAADQAAAAAMARAQARAGRPGATAVPA